MIKPHPRPERMFVLDVDGVLTNPETNVVSRPAVQAIAGDLKAGLPVAQNTGRPTTGFNGR